MVTKPLAKIVQFMKNLFAKISTLATSLRTWDFNLILIIFRINYGSNQVESLPIDYEKSNTTQFVFRERAKNNWEK